jgi:hypothetical protein
VKVAQSIWTPAEGWPVAATGDELPEAHLVLAFGSPFSLQQATVLRDLQRRYPQARVVGCSTAGEICGPHVYDDTLCATAVQFAGTTVRTAAVEITDAGASRLAGRDLAVRLAGSDLAHVLVFSDGLDVNGSALVEGLLEHLPPGVTLTGGLSADGERFRNTLVLHDGEARRRVIAAVGLYGRALRVGYGSLGGWDPFGPDRIITRSAGNVLYELDGKSALALYRQYLGSYAKDLPASGLLFPLLVRTSDTDPGVVRTILGMDETFQSLTFAGDVPQGARARLMKANFDRLIDGATAAARVNLDVLGGAAPELALLISCVGRKLVLRQRTEEEVEAVRDVLGPGAALTGFYSYGEISPLTPAARCELHNQTMTITTFREA